MIRYIKQNFVFAKSKVYFEKNVVDLKMIIMSGICDGKFLYMKNGVVLFVMSSVVSTITRTKKHIK